MKKKLYSTFAMLCLALLMTFVSVQAQSASKLEVNIPFEFQIGNETLPAGEYTIKRLTQNSVLVRSLDGQRKAIARTPRAITGESVETAREKLVFNQYGKKYFLSQVWMARGSDGRELYKSEAEQEVTDAQMVASGGAKHRKVEVAARAR